MYIICWVTKVILKMSQIPISKASHILSQVDNHLKWNSNLSQFVSMKKCGMHIMEYLYIDHSSLSTLCTYEV